MISLSTGRFQATKMARNIIHAAIIVFVSAVISSDS